MDRFPVRLGVAEFHMSRRTPGALALLADRIAGLRGLTHKHEATRRADGTLEFAVRDESGAQHLASWAEFAGYVADSLVMLRREWPQIVSVDIWPIVWPVVKPALDKEPPKIVESVEREICSALIAFVDEFDFDSKKTLYSWAIGRAHAVVNHRLQAERDAGKPVYKLDGSNNDAARITAEQYRAADPLVQLTKLEAADRDAKLLDRQLGYLQRLNHKVREIVRLRLEGKPFREIAKRLGISEPIVRSRYKTGKRNLDAMRTSADRERWRELHAEESAAIDSHDNIGELRVTRSGNGCRDPEWSDELVNQRTRAALIENFKRNAR
jgi:RNA polymerase sigma factor (sigma-70 family)